VVLNFFQWYSKSRGKKKAVLLSYRPVNTELEKGEEKNLDSWVTAKKREENGKGRKKRCK